MQTRLEWIEMRAAGGKPSVASRREICEELAEFIARWRGRTPHRISPRGLAEVDRQLAEFERLLEQQYLLGLRVLVAFRECGHAAEEALVAARKAHAAMKHLTPKQMAEFNRIAVRAGQTEFHAEKFLAESFFNAEKSDRDFQRELLRMESDWPDRIDADLRRSLLESDESELKRWLESITGQLAEVEARAPKAKRARRVKKQPP